MHKETILKITLLSFMTSSMLYSTEGKKLDSVTVTANKVEENIQDVPQSITVIENEIIEEKGIKTVADIIREIPNMTGIPDHGMAVNFRGLNASMFTNNNPIVIYIDGIPTSDRYSYEASLQNIERIEVLRGPQGTLYGKDAIGGVINIVTKEPKNMTSGSIGFEYGTNNYMEGKFNLNTPLINDKLYFNFNTNISSDDGWITNTYNNNDKAAKTEEKKFGTSFFYKITDNLSTKLVLKKEKAKHYWQDGYGILNMPSPANINDFNRKTAENFGFEMPTIEKKEMDSQSLTFKYEADNYNIDAVTIHRKTDMDGIYEGDFTTGTSFDGSTMFNDSSTDFYSQEFRVSTKQTNGIRWVSGLYLDTQEHKQGPYGQDFKYSGSDFMYGNAISTTDSDTSALFGQVMIPLNEQVELTLGGRYQRIEKAIDMTVDSYMLDTNPSSPTVGQILDNDFDFDAKETWDIFIPKLALSYKINNNLTAYTSISKGYMPGGFNYYAASTNKDENMFEPQQSTNYEVGLKGTIDNLVFTAAIFRMDIKDIHVYRQVNGNYFTDNADKAYSQGVEFDFTYFPTDTIEISGALGLIDTKYKSYNNGTNDFSGEKIENTPSHTASLGIAYYHPNGFYARTDIRSQGNMHFYDDANKTFPKINSYSLVDAKIGYRFDDFDIYLYGKNLTDKEYINTYKGNSILSTATFGDPRFIGAGLTYQF